MGQVKYLVWYAPTMQVFLCVCVTVSHGLPSSPILRGKVIEAQRLTVLSFSRDLMHS